MQRPWVIAELLVAMTWRVRDHAPHASDRFSRPLETPVCLIGQH